jgi:hypothetical protein
MFASSAENDIDARKLFPEAAERNLFAASDQKIHPADNISKIGTDTFIPLLTRAKSAECQQSLSGKGIRSLHLVPPLLVLLELSFREILRIPVPTQGVASIRLRHLNFR